MESEGASSSKVDEVKTIQTLAKGLLELYEPPLATINTHLKELTEKQEAVQGMITSERCRLEVLENDAMLDAMLADIASNRDKLVSITNDMMTLHKRVQSLQTRATNVEKVAITKAAQRQNQQCQPESRLPIEPQPSSPQPIDPQPTLRQPIDPQPGPQKPEIKYSG